MTITLNGTEIKLVIDEYGYLQMTFTAPLGDSYQLTELDGVDLKRFIATLQKVQPKVTG